MNCYYLFSFRNIPVIFILQLGFICWHLKSIYFPSEKKILPSGMIHVVHPRKSSCFKRTSWPIHSKVQEVPVLSGHWAKMLPPCRTPWIDWYWSQALLNGALPFYEKISLSDLLLPLLGKLILWSTLEYVLTSRSHRWIHLHSLLVFFWYDVAFITFSEKDQFFIFLFSTEFVTS